MTVAMYEQKTRADDLELAVEAYENALHDVRNLMSILFANIQLLEQGCKASASPEDPIASIKNTSFGMLKLINDAADQSKMRRAALRPVYQNLDVVALLRQMVHTCAGLAQVKDVCCTFASDTRQRMMAVDKTILERIVFNLLSNSIKFTDQSGRIETRLEDKGDRIALTIRDSGVGIPVDRIDRIFERYQCDKRRGNPFGSGVGLSIVRDFVDLLDGEIRVSSGSGGTAFTIELPVFLLAEGSAVYAQRLDGMPTDMVARIELADVLG